MGIGSTEHHPTVILEVNTPLYYILPFQNIDMVFVSQLKQAILWKLDDI